jgi:outer membrane lipoprotein SlyB
MAINNSVLNVALILSTLAPAGLAQRVPPPAEYDSNTESVRNQTPPSTRRDDRRPNKHNTAKRVGGGAAGGAAIGALAGGGKGAAIGAAAGGGAGAVYDRHQKKKGK